MKTARRSFGKPYECQKDWPEDCFVQCGNSGLVLRGGMVETLGSNDLEELGENLEKYHSYTTAFFEAFPRSPDTFIRGEGKTVEEAEEKAWNQHVKFSACDHTEFEKRDYRNGAGFCVKCGMFKSRAFKPWEPCIVCGKLTFYHPVDENTMMCMKDMFDLPYEELGILGSMYTKEEWEEYAAEKKAKGDWSERGDD